MSILFATVQYTLFEPSKLTDQELESHINRTFIALESAYTELRSVWNKPNKIEEANILRKQLRDYSLEVNAVIEELYYRSISMR